MSSLATQLRNEIASHAARYADENRIPFRRTHEHFGSLVFVPHSEAQCHGNFHPASYRAIVRRAIWRKRLNKILTVSDGLKHGDDERRLCELDSCCSSDALLMNVFCHPRVRSNRAVLGIFGLHESSVPLFGWRARVPLLEGKADRTEIDMKFGSVLVEAKLTESSFECCPAERMQAYADFREVFRLTELPRQRGRYQSYQLLRNVLAANAHNASFCLLIDARRTDLKEAWFQVLAAIRPLDIRVRCKLLTWQELARVLPRSLQDFLEQKYGIAATVEDSNAAVG